MSKLSHSRQPFFERYKINEENERFRKLRGLFPIKQLLLGLDTDLLKPAVFRCLCGHYPKHEVRNLDATKAEVTVQCRGCSNKIRRVGSLANAFLYWNRQDFVLPKHDKTFLPLFDLDLSPEETKDAANAFKDDIEALLELPCQKSESALLRLLRSWAQHTYSVADHLSVNKGLNNRYISLGAIIKATVRQMPDELGYEDFLNRLAISTGKKISKKRKKKVSHILNMFAQPKARDLRVWKKTIVERNVPGVMWVTDKNKYKLTHTDVFGDKYQLYFESIHEAIVFKLKLCVCDGKTPYQRSNKKVTALTADLLSGVSQSTRRNTNILIVKCKDATGNNVQIKEFSFVDNKTRAIAKGLAHAWRGEQIIKANSEIARFFDLTLMDIISELPEYHV